ncbi:unnamed protein product, partial [Closterium sp. NIES-64]
GLSLVIARATRLSLYDAFAKEGNISSLYAKGFKCTPLLPSTLPTTGPLTRNRMSDPLAAGLSLVIARATRLPLYDAFAKEGNISDLYAKGEAISVLSSLAGLALGLKLASSVCQTAQAKLAAVPVLAAVHLWSVTEEMRAVPINTLNAQRTNVLINHFLSSGELLSPVDMRWRENIMHLILHKTADGQDAIRAWLLASCISQAISRKAQVAGKSSTGGAGWGDWEGSVREAYGEMEQLLPHMLRGLKDKGWHTHSFLQGSTARRAVW